jgi:pimeloyl-ACP methyl ester carboxylesterase
MSANNIVLVHGAFADGSSWSQVIQRLQGATYTVTAVQPPLTSLEEDIAITRHVVRMQEGAVILVGHSYGGVVITEAGSEPNVVGLVYVAAFAPDAGENLAELIARFPSAPGLSHTITDCLGFLWIKTEAFPEYFAADVAATEARAMAAVQHPWRFPLGDVTQAAWRTKPTWYQISENDQMIHPDLQAFLAERMGARTISLSASHASAVSRPAEIAQLIHEAAVSAATSQKG